MEANTNPLGWPTWAWRCFVALMLVMAAYSFAGSISNFARSANLLRDIGPSGATFSQPPGTPSGWYRVDEIWLVGPAGPAGLKPGDLVQFEGPTGPAEYQLRNRSNWPHPITIERDGRRFGAHLAVPSLPLDEGSRFLFALFGFQSTAAAVLGLVLLIRGRNSRAAAMLAAILLAFAALVGSVPPWMPSVEAAWLMLPLIMSPSVIVAAFWPAFSLEISGGATSRREARLVRASCIAFAAIFTLLTTMGAASVTVPLLGAPTPVAVMLIAANQVFGYAIIARGYRRNDAPARNRIRIVVLAFVCFLLATVLGLITENQLDTGHAPSTLVGLRTVLATLSFAGLCLLVYAVLRQKLFDLNFALNRTLVYAVVSFILLAGFGLGEWGVEHLVPEAWHEGSALFSAAIALALFLSFHRLRDWVEKQVERLLFSSWHRNEAALRRFAGSAAHFEQAPALCRAFAEELARFAEGAGVALYLRAAGGGYKRCAGKLPGARGSYGDDDRAFALMRAERRSVNLVLAHSSLPGALALPMLDRRSLAGFVLLERKSDGTEYRPDELAVLGWATDQVGFAMQAQHVRDLEAKIASLDAQVAAMSGAR